MTLRLSLKKQILVNRSRFWSMTNTNCYIQHVSIPTISSLLVCATGDDEKLLQLAYNSGNRYVWERLALNPHLSEELTTELLSVAHPTCMNILARNSKHNIVWEHVLHHQNREQLEHLASNPSVSEQILTQLYPAFISQLVNNPSTPEQLLHRMWVDRPETFTPSTSFYLHPNCPPHILITEDFPNPSYTHLRVTQQRASTVWENRLITGLTQAGYSHDELVDYPISWLETLYLLSSVTPR